MANSLKKGLVEDPVVALQKTEEAFGELNLPENIKPRAFLTVKFFGKEFGFAGIYSWDVAGEAVPAETEAKPAEATEEAADAAEAVAEKAADTVEKAVDAIENAIEGNAPALETAPAPEK